jgi:hypothetical protein
VNYAEKPSNHNNTANNANHILSPRGVIVSGDESSFPQITKIELKETHMFYVLDEKVLFG